jgi:hypothetical protein
MIEWTAMAAITVVVLVLIERTMRRAEDRLDSPDLPMTPDPGKVSAGPVVVTAPDRGRSLAA